MEAAPMEKSIIGRPSLYSPELGQKICSELSKGNSVFHICAKNKDMPHRSTVMEWLSKHKDFAELYARAREIWADTEFDNLLQIADDGLNDTQIDDDGNVIVNHDVITRSRLRIDTRKWALAKMLPKKYGDRTIVETNVTLTLPQLVEQSYKIAEEKQKAITAEAERIDETSLPLAREPKQLENNPGNPQPQPLSGRIAKTLLGAPPEVK